MKKLILILLFLLPQSSLFLQDIPDCMCVPLTYPATSQLISNLDSHLVIDTCGIILASANCDSAYWNNMNYPYHDSAVVRVWAKKYWNIHFEVDAIPLDSARGDSLLYVTFSDFDSLNYPSILNGFRQLEMKYGNFQLRKVHPQYTTGYHGRYFFLSFDNYVKINEIAYDLFFIDSLDYSFGGWPIIGGTDVNTKVFQNKFSISPNPATDFMEITFDEHHRVNPMVQNGEIEIFDVLGKKMDLSPLYEEGARGCVLNISHLQTGIYFIRIGDTFTKFLKM